MKKHNVDTQYVQMPLLCVMCMTLQCVCVCVCVSYRCSDNCLSSISVGYQFTSLLLSLNRFYIHTPTHIGTIYQLYDYMYML